MPDMLIAVSLEELSQLIREAVRDELARKRAKSWLSTPELAEHFQVHSRTVLYWVQRYGCPHYKIGGRTRFELAAVERWFEARIDGRTVPQPPAPNPHSRRVEV